MCLFSYNVEADLRQAQHWCQEWDGRKLGRGFPVHYACGGARPFRTTVLKVRGEFGFKITKAARDVGRAIRARTLSNRGKKKLKRRLKRRPWTGGLEPSMLKRLSPSLAKYFKFSSCWFFRVGILFLRLILGSRLPSLKWGLYSSSPIFQISPERNGQCRRVNGVGSGEDYRLEFHRAAFEVLDLRNWTSREELSHQ